MDDLVQWLGAQLDVDERIARAASARSADWLDAGTWRLEGVEHAVVGDEEAFCHPHNAPHIAAHDPARVLRDIEAKREALAHFERIRQHTRQGDEAYVLAEGAVSRQIQIMATAYADRPGYKESWRPS